LRRRPRKTGWVKGNYRATTVEWQVLLGTKGGLCRVCGSKHTTLHHLLGGTYRSDEADNLIPLCGDGTSGCHGIYTSRMRGMSLDGVVRTWAQVADRIRRSLSEREQAYVVERVGLAGLEKRYPLTT
jgi:hypothetical protein